MISRKDGNYFTPFSQQLIDKTAYVKSHFYKLTFTDDRRFCEEGFESSKLREWAFIRYGNERLVIVFFSYAVRKETVM